MELCLVLCTKDVNCFAKERCQISTAESIYIIGKAIVTDIELPQVEQNLIITFIKGFRDILLPLFYDLLYFLTGGRLILKSS